VDADLRRHDDVAPTDGSHAEVGAVTPYPTTSLIACGAALLQPGIVLSILLEAANLRMSDWKASGFSTVRRTWLLRAHPPGTPLRVKTGARVVAGHFVDLACDGALVIATADGPMRIVAGEVMSTAGTTAPVIDHRA